MLLACNSQPVAPENSFTVETQLALHVTENRSPGFLLRIWGMF